MAGTWARTVVAGVAFVALACGAHVDKGEDSGNEPSGGRGGSSGGTSPGSCTPTECECPNGLTGMTECPSGECACAQCTEVELAAHPFSIDACGGEPFGTWRATKTEVSEYELHLSNSRGDSITCKGGVESLSGGHYLVEFADGGAGRVDVRAPDVVVLLETSCLEGAGASCEYFEEYECEALDCGLCRCSFRGSSLAHGFTWTREGSALTLRTSESSETLDYCATDTAMVHVNESGRLRYTLEKVYPMGVPEACDARTKETCEGAGCSLGLCVGAGNCDRASDEYVCLLYEDCTWEPETCSGVADESCELIDYVRGIPGCEILSGTPTCVGTAKACMSQPGCTAVGCSIGPGCVGGKYACVSGDNDVPGCACSSNGCTGSFRCDDISVSAVCGTAGESESCRWTKQACIGTPTACSELTPDQCQKTAGCALQAE